MEPGPDPRERRLRLYLVFALVILALELGVLAALLWLPGPEPGTLPGGAPTKISGNQ
jgi:hypothetical protein